MRALASLVPVVLPASCLLAFGVPVAAQSFRWNIPEHGAVVFERTHERKKAILEPDPSELTNRRVAVLDFAPGPAFLLHSDLDAKRTRSVAPPLTVYDLMSHVALDLRTVPKRGRKMRKLDVLVPPLLSFGALLLQVRAQPVGEGPQVLDVAVKPAPVAKGGHDPATQGTLTGTIRVERVLDAERGVVQSFRAEIVGEVHFPSSKPDAVRRASFEFRDEWNLREVVENRSKEFHDRVHEAIRNGVTHLRKKVGGDLVKAFNPNVDGRGETRKSGELALVVLTMLKAGESAFDPVIVKSLDELRRREIPDTYSLAVALMAMEACYTPVDERDQLLAGTLTAPVPRRPKAEDAACMARWVEQLIGNQDTREMDRVARWNYLPGARFDNSNTQYALLGLYAAQLCGIDVDKTLWHRAAQHFLDTLVDDGAPMRFTMDTHQQRKKKKTRRTRAQVEPGGWSYTDKGKLTGSMTTGGVSSLLLCNAAMGRRRPPEFSQRTMQEAIRRGYAWLAQNYSVRFNPRTDPGRWHYYYLYGLERACELGRVALLHDRDWYFDGAIGLLEAQNKNGAFPGDLWDTCFAILFLKKAALPVFTPRR